MEVADYVAKRLMSENSAYGARYDSQPLFLTSVRLPVELVAWVDVIKAKGLGRNRSAVIQVLLDMAIEQLLVHGILGDSVGLEDMVAAVKEGLEAQLLEAQP